MPLDRPIPSFYCCYFLRSTVSKTGAYYIGSTPNPVRRLRQHNGLSKGGAVRTSRKGLRPWEMGCIVSGFPSHIAALQFEWAWQNPHISTHIPVESRISIATAKKKSGHAKRPRLTLVSGLSNLHLLLRMPSFARWPLEIRFFNRDVHNAWQKWMEESPAALPESIQIITDFPPKTSAAKEEELPIPDTKRRRLKNGSIQEPGSPGKKKTKLNYGIDALSIDYANQKSHVEKAKSIVDFEQEGSCSICKIELEHDGGLYAICPSGVCNSVTHLTCLSTHFLDNDDDIDALVPTDGTCPACKSKIRWVDVVKELTLRMRGQKEVDKLLKAKRARKTKEIGASQAADDDSEPSDEELEEQIEAELRELQRLNPEFGDSYLDFERDASDESDTDFIASVAPLQAASTKGRSYQASQGKNSLVTVIEDSDWDEAEVLD